MLKRCWSIINSLAIVTLLASACQSIPTVSPTAKPNTATSAPTVTPVPPTVTQKPTDTPVPPTDTARPTKVPVSGPYLGQTLPDTTPEIFAPDIVSINGRYEYGLAISPDGNELFFTADSPGAGLMVARQMNGQWTEPEVANLRGNNSWEFEAFFTVDGQKLFFTSNESELWQTEKGPDGWKQPQRLDSPVNSAAVFWATFTQDGTMYYTNVSQRKIYRSILVDGTYPAVEDAGFPDGSLHPFVSPDEKFLLFNSSRLGGSGKSDLFVSFRQIDGVWGVPKNLGAEINTGYDETCASLSPDGRYIFFSRYDEPGGLSNIYWVSSAFIDQLKTGETP